MSAVPVLPFKHFFRHEEVTDFVTRLARSRPDLARLSSLGQSREGRAIHLLTLTDFRTGKPEDKPAYLIHGNIHAAELSGTHAALYTARQLLADYPKSDILKRVAFHIVPRINPDGAEFVVTTSGSVRSRTDRSQREPNTLYQEDVNGDGLILTMRQVHPDGPFVADPKDKRLLIRRRKEHKPPFYRTIPEGVIHEWDGTDNLKIEGRGFDWNRNWSYDWRPEPEQWGAGDFPFSEKEMHALAEFIHGRPNLFGVLGYHTGPASMLRPPSTGADTDLDAEDVKIMQELAELGAKPIQFPVHPVVKYHYSDGRDINLRGHFHNFGYHHLGLYVFEYELGILMNSAGISTEQIFATKSEQEREDLHRRMMKWWDKQKKRDAVFMPWKPYRHPQLGNVEIGGLLSRHVAGRTLPDLERVCKGTYGFTLEHASRHPAIRIEEIAVDAVGKDIYRIRARVANRGQFPTHISNKGRNLRRLRPVRLDFRPAKGVKLLSQTGHHDLGHLPGLTGSRKLEWFVSAPSKGTDLCKLWVFGGTGGNASAQVKKPR